LAAVAKGRSGLVNVENMTPLEGSVPIIGGGVLVGGTDVSKAASPEVGRLEPEYRAGAERAMANQVAYHAEKLRLCGLTATEVLSLTTDDGEFTISVAGFTQWSREYATPAGVSVTSTSVPGMGQVLVRPPGGGGPPLGVPPGWEG
jgi:hypothetical protein